jgi:tRNA A37 threonylcarbamoyladenosine modification protein TsaB
VGLSTTAALAAAAGTDGAVAVVLPAGTADRYVARYRGASEVLAPQLLPATRVQAAIEQGDLVLAIDLDEAELGRSAAELGRQAQQGLAAVLARQAAEAHAAGRHDELEALVPSYVAIPRGAAAEQAGMAWSPDLR